MTKVFVLLATYNGSKYIDEQINSLLGQSRIPDKLIISDDHSNDGTWKMLEKWYREYPDLIEVYQNSSGIKGHVGNFSFLCEIAKKTDGSYFLFCDQDDIWLENKIEQQLSACISEENNHEKSTPVLVHSDLKVVDSELNDIAPSFFSYQGLPSAKLHDFPKFLIQNNVTGCTVLINRQLLELASPLPRQVIVHDWWFALVAKGYGRLVFLDKPLIAYRQHSNNAIGAKSEKAGLSFAMLKKLWGLKLHIANSVEQAEQLLQISENRLFENEKLVIQFASLSKQSLATRWRLSRSFVNNPHSLLERIVFVFIFISITNNYRKKR